MIRGVDILNGTGFERAITNDVQLQMFSSALRAGQIRAAEDEDFSMTTDNDVQALLADLENDSVSDSLRHRFQQFGDRAFFLLYRETSSGLLASRQIANGLVVMMDLCVMACQDRKKDLLSLARDLLRHDDLKVRDSAATVVVGLTKLFEHYPDLYDLGINSRADVGQDLAAALELGLGEEKSLYVQGFLSGPQDWWRAHRSADH